MLRSPIKKLVAAILAAALLLTMAMPSAALAAPSPTEAGQAKSYEGNATVRSGESDDWTFVPKGETFASQNDDAFTFTSDSDVWVNVRQRMEKSGFPLRTSLTLSRTLWKPSRGRAV